jgi:hypothetical protein
MRLPRVLTVEERRIIVRALADAAAQTRVTLAQMRTSELLSRDAQQRQRDALQVLADQQDKLSIHFNNTRAMDVAFIEPQRLAVTEERAHDYPNNPRRKPGG